MAQALLKRKGAKMVMVALVTNMLIFFLKCPIVFQPGNLQRSILHIKNVLSVISIPVCPPLIKVTVQRNKEKTHIYSSPSRSSDVGIHATELYSSAGRAYSVWRQLLLSPFTTKFLGEVTDEKTQLSREKYPGGKYHAAWMAGRMNSVLCPT